MTPADESGPSNSNGLTSDPGYHLIIGGCGFLGRHVAALLAQRQARVVIADRAAPSNALLAKWGDLVSWVEFDFACSDYESLLEGASVVHHYAWGSVPGSARDPASDLPTGLQPTLRLLEALRRMAEQGDAPTLVFTSSGGTVYGKVRHVPTREDHILAPINVYGAGKAAAELYLGVYRDLYGLDCRIARLSNPFGAGQDLSKGQGAATTFVHKALSGQPIQIWGDGEVIRDYIHISDAAAGLVAVALAPRREDHWIFNLGSGEGVSLNGIVRELQNHFRGDIDHVHEPARKIDVPISILDISLAKSVLSWSPKLSFSAGISRTLDDVRQGATLSTLS